MKNIKDSFIEISVDSDEDDFVFNQVVSHSGDRDIDPHTPCSALSFDSQEEGFADKSSIRNLKSNRANFKKNKKAINVNKRMAPSPLNYLL